MCQHGQDALNAHGRTTLNTRDAALGDGRSYDAPVGQAGNVVLGRVLCSPRDLRESIDAGCAGTDVRHDAAHVIRLSECDCGMPRAACESARMMALRASLILNVLRPKPLASCRTISAASANAVSPASLPRSDASASKLRHGLWETPPSARRALLILSSSNSKPTATDTSANA